MAQLADSLTLESLRQTIRALDTAAILVEPRILRRVIRFDRRLTGLGFLVPHRKTYTILRERLLAYVEPAELDLPGSWELPPRVILLSKPADDESLEFLPARRSLERYWRLLFHARVHFNLEESFGEQPDENAFAARRELLGEIEFSEIRQVLLKDDLLFPEPTDFETYVEFAAVYLELRYFAEPDLVTYFPTIRDWHRIDQIVSRDIDHRQLFEVTRPGPLSARTDPSTNGNGLAAEMGQAGGGRWHWHGGWFRSATSWARRAAAAGNSVKAAIWHIRSAEESATSRPDALQAANDELQRLVTRLQPVLQMSETDTTRWYHALQPLLIPAADGFWSSEARLLYDLQKVCVEHERGVFRLNLTEWMRNRGRCPIRLPLPLLREVLTTKHLRTATRRVSTARIQESQRGQLDRLLANTVERIEHRSRERIRPVILGVLDEVGLVPRNWPEDVARQNVVEELLDRVVEHGAANLGNLRDALAKNDLKVPDLGGMKELVRGDRLLRTDRKLGRALDGVYRPGAIYLRMTQRLSSLAFGTRDGRFITQFIALPFGGSFVTLKFIEHVAEFVTGHRSAIAGGHDHAPVPSLSEQMPRAYFSAVVLLGFWLLLLIHWPRFRTWCYIGFRSTFRGLRRVLIDFPAEMIRSPIVQRILQSPIYAAIRSYFLRPGIFALLLCLLLRFGRWNVDGRTLLDIYLIAALVLNSPVGRYADEWLGDLIVRGWHELRIRVFAALYQWIMDTFHNLLVSLERLVYSVDEWLRFRRGDSRWVEMTKLVSGCCWYFVSYVVVFVFTLLVEPQINPIKHFPVVTVSHKLILPIGAEFVKRLEPYVQPPARAHIVGWTTIGLIPGVFGFLVWELTGNWRLYEANRARTLRPVPIGHHGETMARLLRPGFHSGTLPKLFAALRRATRKAKYRTDQKLVQHSRAQIQRVELAVRRFVERELLNVLDPSATAGGMQLSAGAIRVATNRIEVELIHIGGSPQRTWLIWEETEGRLVASILPDSSFGFASEEEHRFLMALAGLWQRSGADEIRTNLPLPPSTSLTWNEWVEFWSTRHQSPSSRPEILA